MSEQNQNQFEHLPPPPEQGVYARLNGQYDTWLDRQVERNPQMEKGRLSVITGIIGGVAALGAIKFGPEFANHVVSAFGDKPNVADVTAFSVTAGAAFAAGMNRLDRRKENKN